MRPMWNDGPPLLDFMGSEDAPPVARRHLCYGGGGGTSAPSPPNYSDYISSMTGLGNTLSGYGNSLYNWATNTGNSLWGTAQSVSANAAPLATTGVGAATGSLANWQSMYGPLYQAQANDATNLIKDLPNTEEQWAGKYQADTAQAFDAAKASTQRQLRSYGISQPSIATGAIDLTSANQRAAAVAAAGETGRLQAANTARGVTSTALTQGMAIPQVGTQYGSLGLAAGNQQVNAPESAAATTAGLYSPSMGYYNSSYPYMSAWGNTMMGAYNQQLQQFNANQNASSGWGAVAGSLLGAGAQVGAAYLGAPTFNMAPAGGYGSGWRKGGKVEGAIHFEDGGTFVPPEASPSRGAATDDVPVRIVGPDGSDQGQGAINVGEFIMPKDVTAWRGEHWMQKEVMKARKEMKTQRVAAPEQHRGALNVGAAT